MESNTTLQKSSLALAASWLVVGLPLAWGIWQTLQKSFTLFHMGMPPR